jgi:hypothetical protein
MAFVASVFSQLISHLPWHPFSSPIVCYITITVHAAGGLLCVADIPTAKVLQGPVLMQIDPTL